MPQSGDGSAGSSSGRHGGREALAPDAELDDDFPLRRGSTVFHPIGSCGTGPAADARSVVDDRLRGIEQLRVIAASRRRIAALAAELSGRRVRGARR